MKYSKYLLLLVVLIFNSCQKELDTDDQSITSQSEINNPIDEQLDARNSISPPPCLIVNQTGLDESGCCIYTVKLPKGTKNKGQQYTLNASNGAIVSNIQGQSSTCWEVITCDQTILTLIREADETSYIECNVTLECEPEENCCDDFCLDLELRQDVDENGCFEIRFTFPQSCIGSYLILPENAGLFNSISVDDGFKFINITYCTPFDGFEIEDFIFEAVLFTENCGEMSIGPVAIFNGETDPRICNQDR